MNKGDIYKLKGLSHQTYFMYLYHDENGFPRGYRIMKTEDGWTLHSCSFYPHQIPDKPIGHIDFDKILIDGILSAVPD